MQPRRSQSGFGDGSLFVQSGAEKAARKLLMPPFHGARMRAYGEAIRAITRQWSRRFPQAAPFDMELAMHEISLGVIIRTIAGITDLARATRFRRAFLEFSKPRPVFLVHRMRREFGGHGPWAALLRQRGGVHALIEEEIVLATALVQLRLRLVMDVPVKARYRSVTLSPARGIPMIREARTP